MLVTTAKLLALLIISAFIPAIAQTTPNTAELIDHWKMSKQFTLAVADAMPEGSYPFKPVDEEMSFGALMVHISLSQANRLAQVSGAERPFPAPKAGEKVDKKQILDMLTRSFDFCIAQIEKLTPEQLDKSYKVDWVERPNVNGREVVWGMFTHTAHHRGQAEVYLRLKGIKPPAYRF